MSSKNSGASAGALFNHSTPNRRRVRTPVGGPTLTQQQFADTCDINKIMRKYQRTGAITHFAKYAPEYKDTTACDFQEALNLVNRARKMFDDLPSSIRAEVQTPEGFLAFVQNPANKTRMQELGLVKTDEAGEIAPEAPKGA